MTLGGYSLRLDPWQPDFGASIEDNGELEFGDEAEVGVDLEVEMPVIAWSPRVPGPCALPERLWFVDGVRRVEARMVAGRDGRRFHGVFGAYAVGAVEVSDGRARVAVATVVRLAILGSGQRLPEPIRMERFNYEPDSVAAETVDAPAHGVHNRMRVTEAEQARELAESGLVLTDGPLQIEGDAQGRAIGLVKRIGRFHVPAELLSVLAALPVGGRSPLFALGGRFARFAWYLRLATPCPGDHDLSGLVRLEVGADVGVAEAARLADTTAGWLPRFAGRRGLDPRAPQNLLPVGALEAWLRHSLGDGDLLRRHLRTHLAEDSVCG